MNVTRYRFPCAKGSICLNYFFSVSHISIRCSLYVISTLMSVELTFSRKRTSIDHPLIYFYGIPVKKLNEHKHLRITLDTNLSFLPHINSAISRARKGIGLLKYPSSYLPRHTLSDLSKLGGGVNSHGVLKSILLFPMPALAIE